MTSNKTPHSQVNLTPENIALMHNANQLDSLTFMDSRVRASALLWYISNPSHLRHIRPSQTEIRFLYLLTQRPPKALEDKDMEYFGSEQAYSKAMVTFLGIKMDCDTARAAVEHELSRQNNEQEGNQNNG